jgi:hypothetical protein
MNSVTLYSNGTAVISREYRFEDQEALRISIPVRKTDLDDVISSLSVFGNVTITAPPTYAPTNAQEPALTLNPASVLKDMATKLAGAAVEIEAGNVYKGKLVGLHSHRREVSGTVLEECRLVVLTDKGVQQIDENSVTAIRFTDALIRDEIDKALQARLTQVKPDSSLVEFTIQPNAGTTSALVKYATPVAAWKIRYQLRMSSAEVELEGQAVVDNDTDDDWTETLITTVTGEPVTFSTDLAEIRRPARSRVNIVADQTTGAVVAEPDMPMDADADMERSCAGPLPPSPSRMRAAYPFDRMERAAQVQAEVRESGDFSVFRSPDPVTIGAKRSAIIPLFRAAIGDAKAVLYYNERSDPQRPFRAVRLKNQATHSLGRGVCEVLVDGDFQGKCVLEPTKPGEEVLLIHAKETGVRLFKEVSRPESRLMTIKITEGTIYCEEMNRQDTAYRIQNSHATAFTLEIEHPRTWHGSKLTISASSGTHERTDIPSGQRISVTLEAKASLTIRVIEEQIEEQCFLLDASWLNRNIVDLKAPASSHKGIQKCVRLQGEVDAIQAEIKEQEQAARTLDEEEKRLMKLIPNGHNEQANEWRTDLATTEKELREIKKSTIPHLRRKLQDARKSLQDALSSLKFTWAKE